MSHSSVDTSPCLFLLHPGPPVEGSDQHREKQGKHSGPEGERPEAQERRVWLCGGGPCLEALGLRFPGGRTYGTDPGLHGIPQGQNGSLCSSSESRKSLPGWHAANTAEAVLGSEPAAISDIQAGLIILFHSNYSSMTIYGSYYWFSL